MSKVFSRYFDTSSPQASPSGAILIPGTKRACIALPAPHEGRLNKLVVKQVGGSSADFTVSLFESADVFPVGNSAANGSAALDTDAYAIIAQGSKTAGQTFIYRDVIGQPFANADTVASGPGSGRAIYLVITPTAAGDTSWLVGYTVTTEGGK